MTNQSTISDRLFSLLEGTWTGEGRGEYPGIPSFDYRETLTFTRRDEKSLSYQQQTYKRYDGQTAYLVSHWENGFIRGLEEGTLEMINVQSGGRSELATGSADITDRFVRIHFVSRTLTNDPRMVCTERTFELEGDILRYEMMMQTNNVERLTPHLKIALRRIK